MVKSRRTFLRNSSRMAAGVAAVSHLWGNQPSWAGANDRVRIAVVGIHGMGQNHIREFSSLPNVEVAALCDVDENLFAGVIKNCLLDRGKPTPRTYFDIRKLLEDKDIDAISVVTPNHWHALAGLWSMQAGKHVTIEKPCCHNFFEGQKLVEAARKYPNLMVQDGAEQRSNPCARSAVEFIRKGGLGEVYMAKGICYKWRESIGRTPDEPVPPGVHYDLWLGPASERPFSRNRFHYNWHWNWEYGNGDIGNQGVHEMDIARWGLGVTLPTKIHAIGGHFLFQDDQVTPNYLMATFEFPSPDGAGDRKKILQFEVRGWCGNREGGIGDGSPDTQGYMVDNINVVGNLFYGSKGYMVKDVDRWQAFFGKNRESGPAGSGLGNHYLNFIDAIRAGDRSKLTTNVEEGFYTCALVHFANISYRLGRSLEFDSQTLQFKNDPQANGLLRRTYRHPFVVPDQL
jgi:predicted dehydrogenase